MMLLVACTLLILLVLRVPVAFAIAGSALIFFLTSGTYPYDIFAQQLVSGVNSFVFLAVPFFILAGTLMNAGGMTRRLFDFAAALVGNMTGGLAQVNVLVSTLFGGMSGSATADASFEAKILVPQMSARGYPIGFSAALTATSSVTTALIPPSIGLVIYEFVSNTSIARLFLAGIVPGIMVTVVLMVMVWYIAKRHGFESGRRYTLSWREVVRTGTGAIWAFLLPVIIVGGMRYGVFTPTEGAAVAAVYALGVGWLISREIKVKNLWRLFAEAGRDTALVSLILAVAGPFSWALTVERVPHEASNFLASLSSSTIVMLVIINIFLIVLGTIVDPGPLMIIVVPILMPLTRELGIDPVHFGVVVVFNLLIGAITPPEGSILFAVLGVVDITMTELTKWLLPQLLVLIGVLLLLTYVPAISLALPNLILGPGR